METWLSDVNDFVSDEADDMSYSVRIAALNLIMVSVCSVAMATHVTQLYRHIGPAQNESCVF